LKADQRKISDFIEAVYGDKPARGYIQIWSLPSKKSAYCQNTSSAIADIIRRAGHENDIYIGCGLSPRALPSNRRCPKNQIDGIPGVWADIDFTGEHSKKNLPTIEEADRIISKLPKPTMIINSGHGYHVWWLFKEIWYFADKRERDEAQDLMYRFARHLIGLFDGIGREVDNVSDLSRILRITGTINNKRTPPVMVRFVNKNEIYYNPDDLAQFVPDVLPYSMNETVDGKSQRIILKSNANPPFDKFSVLQKNITRVVPTWERKRRDLKDTSASGYDMALATISAQAGWSDQEIADLLIASRRKHGDDLKLNRPDYYKLTIAKARSGIQIDIAEEKLEEVLATPDKSTVRSMGLEAVSSIIGVKIIKMIKYLSDPPLFELITDRGAAQIGTSAHLINQTTMRAKIHSATGVLIRRQKEFKWDRIVQALTDACEEIELGQLTTIAGTGNQWTQEYIDDIPPHEITEDFTVWDALQGEVPFIKDNQIFIFSSPFRKWLKTARGENYSHQEIALRFRAAGYTSISISARADNGRVVTRAAWTMKISE